MKELLFLNVRFKGGGGGGGSGVVDYPAYMKTWHGIALDNSGGDVLTNSLTDAMNAASGNSPWAAQVAYDPDADIAALIAGPTSLQTLVTLLSTGTTLDTLISDILDPTRIAAEVAAFAADLDARLLAEVLPRFESGMRDINAVTSSAFAIGRAIIEVGQDRQVASFSATLHSKAGSDDAIKIIQLKLEYQKAVSQMIAEAYRVKIVAKKEEGDSNMAIDDKDALWDLQLFQYGANLLAAIGGGTASPETQKPSTAQSMIGGAMAGAAAGASFGPYGAAAGAVIGAGAALMAS